VNYLADTSALTRILRRQVDPAWYEVVDRGLITVCEPVLAEALQIADTKDYGELEQTIVDTYVLANVPDNI